MTLQSSKGLPQDFLDSLAGRIIAARREKLRGMLPSAIEGTGQTYDKWFDDVRHRGEPDYHLWGNRWKSTMSTSMTSPSDDGSSLSITFTITFTTEKTGEVWNDYPCELCGNGED